MYSINKNNHEPDTLKIWVKGELVEVYSEDGRRNYGVQTKTHYVMDRQTGKFVPEGEETIQLESKAESLTSPGYFGLKLKKQERKTVQIIGERPFSVYYGDIKKDDPLAADIHEIANDPNGLSYQNRKLDDEEYIRPVLVRLPKKEISLVPQDHSRYTDHVGKRTRALKRA